MNEIILYIAGGLTAAWGISHLFPTKGVVKGFGEITPDSGHIITMEWIVEGVALIFIGVLVVITTLIDRSAAVAQGVYWSSAGVLIILAIVSLFTGFKVNFLPFKLCPVIFTLSAVLILVGMAI